MENSVICYGRIGFLGVHNLYECLIPALALEAIIVNATDLTFVNSTVFCFVVVVVELTKSLQF